MTDYLGHPNPRSGKFSGAVSHFWCDRCAPSKQLWREGGQAVAESHNRVWHPGHTTDGFDFKMRPTVARVSHDAR